MSEIWQRWLGLSTVLGRGLLSWSWQAGLLLAGAWVVTLLVPRRRPTVRNALWLAALVLLPVIPVATRLSPLPPTSLEALRGAVRAPSGTALVPGADAPSDAAASVPEEAATPVAQPPSIEVAAAAVPPGAGPGWTRHLIGAAMLLWVAGVAVMLLRLRHSARWVRRLYRSAPDVDEHTPLDIVRRARRTLDLPRPVDLRESDMVKTPVTVGLIWPVVVLPEGLLRSGRRSLIEHAVCHEMAHVKRWDSVVTLYRRLLEAVLFFHPLVWLASRRYELEQEHLCDDWAVGMLRDPQGYARSLTELAERAVHGPRMPALSFAHRPGVMRRRVTRLVEGREMGSPRLGLSGTVLVFMVALLLLAGAGSLPLTRASTVHAADAPPDGRTGMAEPVELSAEARAKLAEARAMAEQMAADTPAMLALQHDDGTMDGQRSLGGSGHFVQFQCPPGKWWLTEVQIYGSRYGMPQPPPDPFTIALCDQQFQVVKFIRKPYSIFAVPGEGQFYPVAVPPLELPTRKVEGQEQPQPVPFWINVAFNPSQTKGVLVAYDSSNPECFSKAGLPNETPRDIPEGYDWMIRLVIANAPPKEPRPDAGEWLEPIRPPRSWQDEGLIELKNDDGESDGRRSIGGAGPVVRFDGAPPGATLTRLRIYASVYGGGFDPATTYSDYYVYDDRMQVLQTGRIPYSLFSRAEKWVDVPIDPVAVPAVFSVLINPDAHQTKGILFHYDTDVFNIHSMSGRTPQETRPLSQPWDWMIRAYCRPPDAGAP